MADAQSCKDAEDQIIRLGDVVASTEFSAQQPLIGTVIAIDATRYRKTWIDVRTEFGKRNVRADSVRKVEVPHADTD